MKTTNKFTATLSRTISPAALRYIYDALEVEEKPYEARVANVHNGKRLLTMQIHKENKLYFQNLVTRACDEAKV